MAEEMKIVSSDPLVDYSRLINTYVVTDKIMSDDLIQENFRKVSEVAHGRVWELLFGAPGKPKPADRANGAALLEACKADASFHSPWLYNQFIVTVRDELLKRDMVDFWRDILVERELGPCSNRDCDMFDSEDELPFDFYERAGCKAPFPHDTRESVHNFHAVIGDESPLADYKQQIKTQLQSAEVVSDELLETNSKKIFEAAQLKIWHLLFDEQPPSPAKLKVASDFLQEYKKDAAFYEPLMYNEWIVRVRDELLKREMLDFWRNEMVKRELGPCWARDSDCFDDMDDPAPEAFYKFAGCEAPFQRPSPAEELAMQQEVDRALAACARVVPLQITLEKPLLDYTAKLQYQLDLDGENKQKLNEIFGQARDVIWKLLFDGGDGAKELGADSFKKAADLLEAYKRDACFYNPYDYNEWIVRVRDELFKRKFLDFWQKVVVEKECGLCWYKDCEFFDDREDKKPIEFYESGKDLKKD